MTPRTSSAAHFVGGIALALASTACSSPRAPSPPHASASAASRPSAAPGPRASLAAPPQRPPPEPLPDGCATAVPNGLAPAPRLEAVARACARGMRPLAATPSVGTLEAGASLALPFTLPDASACVRAAAVGSAGIEELALEVRAADDRVLGADQLRGPLALANPDGPICPPAAGNYRAIARALRGRGEVALQAWLAE